MASSNPLKSKRSNLELSPANIRRPSSAPYERWTPNEASTSEPNPDDTKSPLFVKKFGKKHHAFWNVPWPICYEREILDLDVLNYQFLNQTIKGLSFVRHESPPMRILDIGTGVGSWVLDAAQKWTASNFVGLDIVPIQPDLEAIALDPSVRARIQWVNANFLQRLPFGDASFDYVRCVNIARGVPENKWVSLFEEISRVMAPGASLEVVVENIVFPYVPRIAPPSAGHVPASPVSPSFGEFAGIPRHSHYFLERIFFDVFERRFINVRPTKIINNYLNMHFRSVAEYPIQVATSPNDMESKRSMEQVSNSPTQSRMPTVDRGKVAEELLSVWASEVRAWQGVVGCKENMWEEVQLKSKDLGGDILDSLPWTDKELRLRPRQRFELLFDRYEQEMRERTALPNALRRGVGWGEPWREGREAEDALDMLEGGLEGLGKERIRLSQSSSEDVDPSRLISCFVGFKGDVF